MNSEGSSTRGRIAGFALLLAALAFFLYWRTGEFELLNYDDPDYVTANRQVSAGLSAEGVRWAFGFHAANWHPLTWMSHMLDVEFLGPGSGPMHRVNAGLHALNTALLFLALTALTRRGWPALVVAALFAAHPLRVQVVAWVSERKELLASTCFLALLLAYARHARRPTVATHALLVVLMALGCMAKPMLVTAPFVLLLLDVWPLRRLAGTAGANAGGARSAGALFLEKAPLLALAAATCVLTVLAQRAGGAIGDLAALPLMERVWTAGAGVLAYLRATVWPSGLAAFYPHPAVSGGSLLVPGIAGLVVALGASALAWRSRACCGALFTGWFWFLGMLVPVLGLVQVGDQAWADRYAYLPTIGLYVALVYGIAESARVPAGLRPQLALAGIVAAVVLGTVTLRVLPHWRDSKSLFERALAVTEDNWIAHNNLGLVLLERRETARARDEFERAARIRPSFVQARYNLALALEAASDFEHAIPAYQELLRAFPGHKETLLRLAALARASGDGAQAVAFFEQALAAHPRDAGVWLAFGRMALEMGDIDRAKNCADSALKLDGTLADAHLVLGEVAFRRGELGPCEERVERALELAPRSTEAYALLGRVRHQQGDAGGARAALERALQLDPSSARVRYDLGTILLGLGERERESARAQFKAVNDINPGDPQALTALGVMALEDGAPEQAIELFQEALARRPGFVLALTNLARAYEIVGDFPKALDAYEKSFTAGPATPEAACAAAWILATGPDEELLDGPRAVELALYATQRKAVDALEVLAAAYARAGDFEKAVEVQTQALERAPAERKQELEERLELYRAEKPYTRTK